MKLLITLILIFSTVAGADTLSTRPLRINGETYTKTKTYGLPPFLGRKVFDLTDLSGKNEELKTLQDKYERYHVISTASISLSLVYALLAGFGAIKPSYTDDVFRALVPWLGLVGVGVGFTYLGNKTLDQYADVYNKNPGPLSSVGLGYSWRF